MFCMHKTINCWSECQLCMLYPQNHIQFVG